MSPNVSRTRVGSLAPCAGTGRAAGIEPPAAAYGHGPARNSLQRADASTPIAEIGVGAGEVDVALARGGVRTRRDSPTGLHACRAHQRASASPTFAMAWAYRRWACTYCRPISRPTFAALSARLKRCSRPPRYVTGSLINRTPSGNRSSRATMSRCRLASSGVKSLARTARVMGRSRYRMPVTLSVGCRKGRHCARLLAARKPATMPPGIRWRESPLACARAAPPAATRAAGWPARRQSSSELAEGLICQGDRPGADHTGAHHQVGGLQRVVPVAVAVVDERRAGREARLAVGQHPVTMGPEGFARPRRLTVLGIRVADLFGQDVEVVRRFCVITQGLDRPEAHVAVAVRLLDLGEKADA